MIRYPGKFKKKSIRCECLNYIYEKPDGYLTWNIRNIFEKQVSTITAYASPEKGREYVIKKVLSWPYLLGRQ